MSHQEGIDIEGRREYIKKFFEAGNKLADETFKQVEDAIVLEVKTNLHLDKV